MDVSVLEEYKLKIMQPKNKNVVKINYIYMKWRLIKLQLSDTRVF